MLTHFDHDPDDEEVKAAAFAMARHMGVTPLAFIPVKEVHMAQLMNSAAIEHGVGELEIEATMEFLAEGEATPDQTEAADAYAEGVTQALNAYGALGRAFGLTPQFD